MNILGIYLLGINLVTFLMYWYDKQQAKKNRWRISEGKLLSAALAGGSFGALAGMYLFRHKTKHWKFKILIPVFCVLHIVLFFYLIMK